MAELRRQEEEEKKGKDTTSYVGGEKSGLAVLNKDDTPAQDASAGASSAASAAAPAPVAPEWLSLGQGTVSVDESKPTTTLQFRFHDGQKKQQQFNEDQTVADLRSFCSQVLDGKPVNMKAGFPPKMLTDDSKTLKEAGLLKETVVVSPA